MDYLLNRMHDLIHVPKHFANNYQTHLQELTGLIQ